MVKRSLRSESIELGDAAVVAADGLAVGDTPCVRRTGAGWKSHTDAPSPMPAAKPKNSPRLSAGFPAPTIDGGDPCQQFQGD